MVSLGCTCGPQWCSPHPCPLLRAVPGLTAAVMESGMVGTDAGFHDPGDVSRRKVGGEGGGASPDPCPACAGQELAPNGLSCSCEEHEVLVM